MYNTIQWSRRRKISFAFHALYALATLSAGTYCALLLWQSWFDSWWIASAVIMTAEFLCILSLILKIAQVEWPLSFLRHALPYLAVIPVGWELHNLLAANPNNDPTMTGTIAILLTAWFVYLEFRILHSLEELFIDPITAAREAAKEEMGRTAIVLARFQETKNAAESFAKSVLLQPVVVRPFNPIPLQLEESMTLQLTENADPRFVTIMKLASKREANGDWTYDATQIREVTHAAPELIETVCKIVRSGQVVIS